MNKFEKTRVKFTVMINGHKNTYTNMTLGTIV